MARKLEYIVKEVRNLLAVYIRDMVFRRGAMSKKAQEDLMEQLFLGSGLDTISQVERFLDGDGDFDRLWDETEIQNNETGNEHRRRKLVLKEVLHCLPASNFVAHKGEFVKERLFVKTKNAKAHVGGRALTDNATQAIMCAKHALAMADQVLVNGELPSGWSTEDLYVFVRKKMYVKFFGKFVPPNDDETEAVEEGTMPEAYLFCGYMLFVAFGPFPLSGRKLDILALGESSTPEGRAASRKAATKLAKEERDAGYTGKPSSSPRGPRGISNDQRAGAATLAESHYQAQGRGLREDISHAIVMEENLVKQYNTAFERWEKYESKPGEAYEKIAAASFADYSRLNTEIEQVKAMRGLLQTQLELHRNRAPVAFSDYYDRLGLGEGKSSTISSTPSAASAVVTIFKTPTDNSNTLSKTSSSRPSTASTNFLDDNDDEGDNDKGSSPPESSVHETLVHETTKATSKDTLKAITNGTGKDGKNGGNTKPRKKLKTVQAAVDPVELLRN